MVNEAQPPDSDPLAGDGASDHAAQANASPDSGSAQPDPDELLLDAVADFVRLHEAHSALAQDLDAFVARYPESMREPLRAMCLAHQGIARELDFPGLDASIVTGQASAESGADHRRLGEFTILDELGRGGMGVVYLAEQAGLERRVALKVLNPALSFSSAHKARFRREVAAVGTLQHPGIVPIHAFGEFEGTLYYAMEFVPGRDLAQTIRSLGQTPAGQRKRLGLLPNAPFPVEVAELIAQIADALEHAHSQGIVHRDIKPNNIVLGADGTPRILDFGLAKRVSDDSDAALGTLTLTGDLAGTPFYMSPEQTLGRRGEVDGRSDLFSLGVILYELCTGHRPFVAEDLQSLIAQICFSDPTPIHKRQPNIPRDLGLICGKALEKDPKRRYASAKELAADLRRFTSFRPIQARPVSVGLRARRWMQRHRLAALLMVVGCIGGLVWWSWNAWHGAQVGQEVRSLLAEAASQADRSEYGLAEDTLLAAIALRPQDALVQARLEEVRQRESNHRIAMELERQSSLRLISQASLEVQRDPSLALALMDTALRRGKLVPGVLDAARETTLAALERSLPMRTLGASTGDVPDRVLAIPSQETVLLAGKSGVWLLSLTDAAAEPVRLPTRSSRSLSVAASEDGTRIAVLEEGGRISLWSLPELNQFGEVTLSGPRAQSLDLSSDGKLLAMRTGRNELRLYDVSETEPILRHREYLPRRGTSIEFAPGGKRLLVQLEGREVRVLEGDGTTLWIGKGGKGTRLPQSARARWLPDGSGIVRADTPHSIAMHRFAGTTPTDSPPEGQAAATEPQRFAFPGQITTLAISTDGQHVGVGCADQTGRVWEIASGRELRVLAGHTGMVQGLHLIRGRTGSHLALTRGDDRLLLLHDLETGKVLRKLPQPSELRHVQVLGACEGLLCHYDTLPPRLWDLTQPPPVVRFQAHGAPARSVQFAQGGRRLITTGDDGFLAVWDGVTGARQSQVRIPGLARSDRWVFVDEGEGRASVIASEHLSVRSLHDWKEELAHAWLRTENPGPGPRGRRGAYFAAQDPDKAITWVVEAEGVYRIHFDEQGQAQRELFLASDTDPILTFVPLGEDRFALTRARSGVEWRTPEREFPVLTAAGKPLGPGFLRAQWNPTSQRLAVAGNRRCAIIDAQGQWLTTIEPDQAVQTALAWNPDGTLVLLGHRNGTVTLWDATSGALVGEHRPHQEGVQGLAVSPDGQRVASCSIDRSVALWPIDPIAMARDLGIRPLSMGERQRFDMMRPVHERTKAWVDGLYRETVLTQEVLDRITQRPEKPVGLDFEVARAYALERGNPSAQKLHAEAAKVLYDPDTREERVRTALVRVRAAARLQRRNANHLILAALGEYRLGEHHQSLQSLERALEIEGPALENLAWAIRALNYVALNRRPEAESAVRQMRGPGDGRGNGPPGGRPPGRQDGRPLPQPNAMPGPQGTALPSARGRLYWLAEARRLVRDA